MKKEDRITIFLSPGELFWIAGHLGLKTIPLLGGAFRGRSPEEVRTAIQQGFEALINRNLVHRQGLRVVELDSTLTSVVTMVATPDYTILINSMRKDETPFQAYLFFKDSQSISVIFQDRFFHFSLVREDAALQRSLLNWMGIGGQISERALPFRSPVNDLPDLMQKFWAQPDMGVDLLKGTGLSLEDATRQADFFGQIAMVSLFKRINFQTARLSMQGQVVLVGNTGNLWAYEGVETSGELPVFQPLAASKAAGVLARYLRADLTLESKDEELLD
jgi:hypothetical protein